MGSRFLRLGMPRKPTAVDGSGSPRIRQNQVINSMLMVRRSRGFLALFCGDWRSDVTNGIHNITGYIDLFSPLFLASSHVLSGFLEVWMMPLRISFLRTA